MIDHVEAGTIERRREALLRQRHADRIADALAQRPGGDLDPSAAVLRMAGGANPLPERFQLARSSRVAGEIEQRIQQHRGVPVRKHETVAVRPLRIAGLWRMWSPQRTYAMSAMPIGIPGWPDWLSGRRPSRALGSHWQAAGGAMSASGGHPLRSVWGGWKGRAFWTKDPGRAMHAQGIRGESPGSETDRK